MPMGPPTTPCPSSRRGGESRIATSMLSLLSAQPLSLGRAHTVQEVPGRQTLSPFKLKLEKFQKRSLAAHDTQTPTLGEKRARRMLAKELTPQYDPNKFDEIDTTLLDTFDDIGALFSRDLIDRDLVGGQLGFYVDRWWIACKPYVDDVRKRNMSQDWFSGFESLAKVMAKNDPHLSDEDVKRFLADESHLVTYDQTKQ